MSDAPALDVLLSLTGQGQENWSPLQVESLPSVSPSRAQDRPRGKAKRKAHAGLPVSRSGVGTPILRGYHITSPSSGEPFPPVLSAKSLRPLATPERVRHESEQTVYSALGPSGFDTLQRALEDAVRLEEAGGYGTAASADTLDDTWEVVGRWLQGLKQLHRVKAALAAAEGFLAAEVAATSKYVQPCNPRCTAVLTVLDQLLAMLSTLLPESDSLIAMVRGHLAACIFPVKARPSLTGGRDTEDIEPLHPLPSLALDHRSIAESSEGYKGLRTFFQATRMLSQRLTGQVDTAEAVSRRRAKEMTILERIVKVDQQYLLRCVFNAWRGVRGRRLQEDHLKQSIEERTQQLFQMESKLVRLELSSSEQIKQAREQALFLQNDVNLLHDRLGKKTTKEESLRKKLQIKELEVEKIRAETTRAVVEAQEKCEEMVKAVRSAIQEGDTLAGSKHEEELREKVAEVLQMELSEEETLRVWINEMVQHHPCYKPSCHFRDFAQGAESLDAFCLLLHSLSPVHFTGTNMAALLSSHPSEKAEWLVEGCAKLGIGLHLDAEELVGSTEESREMLPHNHQLFVTTLFQRVVSGGEVSFSSKRSDDAPSQPRTDRRSTACSSEAVCRRLLTSVRHRRDLQRAAEKVQKHTWQRVTDRLKRKDEKGPKVLTLAEQADYDKYTVVSVAVVEELLAGRPQIGAAPTSPEEEAEAICSVLRQHFPRLRAVYRKYASEEGGEIDDMSLREFWRLITDCKIPDKAFNRVAIASVFSDSNANQDTTLTPSEWVEGLVRLAAGKFADDDSPLSKKLVTLLHNHILAYAKMLQGDFKKQVYDREVQHVLSLYRPQLNKIFRHYAYANHKSTRAKAAEQVDFCELQEFARDTKIMDDSLNYFNLQQLFINVVGESSLDQGLLPHEFNELLCGASIFKYPAPFVSLSTKVTWFLDNWVIPALERKFGVPMKRKKG